MGWRIPRHGICQMFQFYVSKIAKKTRKLRHFWQTKKENVRCFTHLFWTNWQFLCNYLLRYKLTPVILWNSCLNSANSTRAWKYFTQMAFVTNSRSENSSKRNTLSVLAIQLSVPVKTFFLQPYPTVRILKHMSDKNCWMKCLYLCCHQTLSPTHVIKRACITSVC